MAVFLPTGPITVKKTFPSGVTQQKVCRHYVELRDALIAGFERVRSEEPDAVEEEVELPEDQYNIATVAELEKKTKEELLDWALAYGLDLPNNSRKEKILEQCIQLRQRKINANDGLI